MRSYGSVRGAIREDRPYRDQNAGVACFYIRRSIAYSLIQPI